MGAFEDLLVGISEQRSVRPSINLIAEQGISRVFEVQRVASASPGFFKQPVKLARGDPL